MVNRIKTIHSIELENFKGYRLREGGDANLFDMTVDGQPADLILVTGKNGVGKTSLLEAMDWVLNQSGVGAGEFKTTGQSKGAVCINGARLELHGSSKTNRRKLNTVASFFYQENIKELACNEIIQLLEPENKPATEIRQGLKSLKAQLENWQRQLHALKYSKNYEEERKDRAGKINQLVAKLPKESLLRKELDSRSLTLINGNLQSKWGSQIRNLSSSIGEISNLVEPVGAQLPEQLGHIGSSLLEYKVPQNFLPEMATYQPDFTRGFLSAVQSLPDDLYIKKWRVGADLAPSELSNTIFIDADIDVYADTVAELEHRQEGLNDEYHRLNHLRGSLHGNDESLSAWIDGFKENVSDWLHVWDKHPDAASVSELKSDLDKQIGALSLLSNTRLSELNEQIENISVLGKSVASRLNQARRSQEVANVMSSHSAQLSSLLDQPDLTAKGLGDYISDFLTEISNQAPIDTPVIDEASVINELGKVFIGWANLEVDKKQDEAERAGLDGVELAEKMISDSLAICKQESGAKSQLLSVVGVIPQAELEQLLRNMNQLLSSFHFPEDFLPIELENHGTEKNQKWGFKTSSGVKFADLSTGQKSQLAICWTINLNLALSEVLDHRVIGFDDFTTSLDMNQMIPAAVLLRKLAYAENDDSWKRQVIVTSHHEDLTNRLLDFLLPPTGKLMKVIQFEDWTVESGPKYKCYNVDMGDVCSDGLDSAIKRVVSGLR